MFNCKANHPTSYWLKATYGFLFLMVQWVPQLLILSSCLSLEQAFDRNRGGSNHLSSKSSLRWVGQGPDLPLM